MATLLDQYGNPIDLKRLTEEESGPTLAGVRQILSDHPSSNLTPRRLAAILLEAEQGDADSYLELAEDMEEKDLHYRAVLGTRRLQVSQLPTTIEAASDAPTDQTNADLVREHLVDSGVIGKYLFDMMDAVGKGFSVGEILWSTTASLWAPTRIEWRDPRWFQFDRVNGRTLLLKGGAAGIGMPEPLKSFGYVVHAHRTKSGLPIRGGLARAVAWLYLFKNFDIKAWVEFLEVFGQPIRLGKYHSGASEPDKATLLRAVRNLHKDAAAIIPDSMMVELIEAKISGTITVQKEFAEWADRQVSKAVLGQTGTTDVGQHVGTAKAHDKVKDDIERDDADQIGDTLNEQLVRPFIDLNRGPQPCYPRLVIRRPDPVDTKLFMDSVKTFVDMGGEVEQSVVRDVIGLPDPPKGKDVKLLRPAGTGTDPAVSPIDPARLAIQSQQAMPEGDALDDLAAAALEGWQPMMDGVLSPIERLAAQCADADEFRRRLPEILADMDTGQVMEVLARSCFAARAAGEVEAEIGPETV